jgi:hypothetical protein
LIEKPETTTLDWPTTRMPRAPPAVTVILLATPPRIVREVGVVHEGKTVVAWAVRSRIAVEIIFVLAGRGFAIRTPRLPGRLEQRQLLF